MTTSARLPAGNVATAATALHERLRAAAAGEGGMRGINSDAMYRAAALARLAAVAAVTGDRSISIGVEDFDLIGSDYQAGDAEPTARRKPVQT